MYTCALVGAADFNDAHFIAENARREFDYVIAVDGGFEHLKNIGVRPTMALGDFDSLGYVPQASRVAQHPVEKDQSDMELAIERACTMRAEEIFIYGGLSGRLDHTIANLQVCAGFAERSECYITAVSDEYAARILVGPDVLDLPLMEEGEVSLFSLTPECSGLIVRGLKYELDDAKLGNRTSLCLSNEMIGQDAAVALEEGTLLVIYPLAEDERAAKPFVKLKPEAAEV